MSIRVLMVSIVGLVGLVVPAHATFSYQADVSDFDTAASGLTLSTITTFTSADLVSGTPFGYADPGTLVDFLDFNNSAHEPFTVSIGALVEHSNGYEIEIILPTAVFAFA